MGCNGCRVVGCMSCRDSGGGVVTDMWIVTRVGVGRIVTVVPSLPDIPFARPIDTARKTGTTG